MKDNVLDRLAYEGPLLYLAPQAGVSESPFRRLCRRFGAEVVVSEFVSADGVVRHPERSHAYLRFDPEEHPIGVQIFGSDPEMMAEAAAYVTETYGPDFIDINFGCPVKKVVKRNGGSGCLRDLELVARIVRAVDRATPLPVTVKMRSGFDEESRDPVRIALLCEEAGARAICLHPRTREEMYSGQSRWDEIADLVQAVQVPVIGNGDVRSGGDAVRMWERTGCHGIMIARGSHGSPWLFRQVRAALDGEPVPPDPDVATRFEICIEHCRNQIAFGEDPARSVLELRKHLGWYTKGLPDGRTLRQELFHVTTLEEIEETLGRYAETYAACRSAA